ncbi:helix-turn-helix domain-containing protein [Vagococcus hydrophili]|uniref:Helix-turn-helix transcriptional regulator n=1 Tax=Vagococcus hydrophili TaxID=2714947 RepID=A0A6G8AXS6_9ENTE|nr:helix-turn-helix transcriptional regulator [Vagococcus hydrophili]QIL49683.1 helix-turn-helix transcriptional regulator [Vagococcus hydrophili]
MILHEQLKIERKKKGISVKDLTEIIEDEIGINLQVSTIQRWEQGSNSIDTRVLGFLSELYEVSIEDLVSEDIDPIIDNKDKYYQFGKNISAYCLVQNISEFVRKYEIANRSEWVVAPKYDLIMRCYEDFLKEDETTGYHSIKSAYKACHFWLKNCEKRKENELIYCIFDDAAGYLSIREKRDPVDYIGVLEELEILTDDISGYLELFETGGFEKWDYI